MDERETYSVEENLYPRWPGLEEEEAMLMDLLLLRERGHSDRIGWEAVATLICTHPPTDGEV